MVSLPLLCSGSRPTGRGSHTQAKCCYLLPLAQEVCAALGAPGVLPESPWWMVSTDAETILGYTGESSIRDVESPNFITGGSLDAPEQRAGWEFRHSVNETYKAVVPDSGASENAVGSELVAAGPAKWANAQSQRLLNGA